ncbi:Purine nucleoside phosphorylase [Komagataella phaffii CBS 7435]|uniref:Purine nucleoside phosphorylase n=2 Tax=Komagataella phaffii TaxID=460519 RepID=C4QW73_KOMPG|nr:uncharacterized protein PAS_chr1-1_0132 [Komagataella phaffii GS115]AOA61773.1 GQ67_02709T0 [Komagataella phaffii]KAI0465099.1 hypothetical protein LJB42_000318 [Komagataella kurtzmanii]CAH2446164.1 Purine nucleoside phosphorylase [Komagataella phaffii CBS 7435]AOA66841.1 GQ68_02539T0 [Komagataella phaffii GS115]CAY67496.1 Purine nucleoside phosphorylase, specifically metabolizes inosine & guanosine nucleosides [Komagataella phaffii GS115]
MSSTQDYYDLIADATASIRDRVPAHLASPKVLIICGSGLGGIASRIKGDAEVILHYETIPGFQKSTVAGHAGHLQFGLMGIDPNQDNLVPVICMVGRLHFYEGYSFQAATFPVRVATELGVETVIITNAAGGVNPRYVPGDLMIMNDHINFPGLSGQHPLKGPNLEKFGPRFPATSDAYDLELRKALIHQAEAANLSRTIHEGVYAFVSGPTFESRAEVRMLRLMGADAVGMSSVPEVVVARHSGLKVLGLSLITNSGVSDPPTSAFIDDSQTPDSKGHASHEEVLLHAQEAAQDVETLVERLVGLL